MTTSSVVVLLALAVCAAQLTGCAHPSEPALGAKPAGAASGLAEVRFSRVSVPSMEMAGAGTPLPLLGHWSPAPRGHGGAVVMLHGCSGPYEAGGGLAERMRDYAARFQAQGWSVLVLDSLTPRGERELCTQKIGQRRVTQANRRLDVWGALKWMAEQPGVDARKLGLIGWSHGGSAVLAALQADRYEPRAAEVPRPAFGVAYYPGCGDVARVGRAAAPAAPLLMQLGREDDWTPAQPCINWAESVIQSGQGSAAQLEVAVYPQAYHGFDGTAPLRLRADVPNGVRPGSGVHVGGHPPSRDASLQRLSDWLARFATGFKPGA